MGVSLRRARNQLRDGQFEGLNPFLLLETQDKNTLETDSCQSVLAVGLDSDRGPKYVTEALCTTQPQIWPPRYHSRSRSSCKELVLCLGYSRMNFGSLSSLSLLLLTSVSCQCGVYIIKPSQPLRTLSKLCFAFHFVVVSGIGGDNAWALFSGLHFTWLASGSLDLHT